MGPGGPDNFCASEVGACAERRFAETGAAPCSARPNEAYFRLGDGGALSAAR